LKNLGRTQSNKSKNRSLEILSQRGGIGIMDDSLYELISYLILSGAEPHTCATAISELLQRLDYSNARAVKWHIYGHFITNSVFGKAELTVLRNGLGLESTNIPYPPFFIMLVVLLLFGLLDSPRPIMPSPGESLTQKITATPPNTAIWTLPFANQANFQLACFAPQSFQTAIPLSRTAYYVGDIQHLPQGSHIQLLPDHKVLVQLAAGQVMMLPLIPSEFARLKDLELSPREVVCDVK
jgi:hypothetical protein